MTDSGGDHLLKRRLATGQPIRVLWTISPRGRFHLGLLLPLLRLRALSRLGCRISVLITGVPAFLDDEKCPWTAIEHRVVYLRLMIEKCAELLGIRDLNIATVLPAQFNE